MVIVAFPPGEKYAVNYTTLDQYDYGQILRIQGLKLPKTVEVHFSTQETGGTSITRVGVTKDGVTDVLIPDSVLENGDTTQNYSIFAFVYITDATSGKTEYRAKLEVKARPKPEVPGGNDNPDVFRDAVLAVRESALKAEEDAKKTTEDRKAVEHAVESVKDITEQVARVEELSRNAQEAATQTQNAAQGIITDREQINANKEGVAQLKEDLSEFSEQIRDLPSGGGGAGWTTAQIDLLDEIGNYIPFTSSVGGQKWDALIESLRGNSSGEEPDTPDNPEVTLTSISATYTGGNIAVGTALTDLAGIVVVANYSDGSTQVVTGYTLSGTIAEGENTITVSYSGKTATFTVVGVAESSGEDTKPLYTFEDAENVEVISLNNAHAGKLTISNGNHVKLISTSTNNEGYQKWFFNMNISSLASNGVDTPTDTWFIIPNGATVKLCVKNLSQTGVEQARLGLNSHESIHSAWVFLGNPSSNSTEFTFTANSDKDIKCVYLDVLPSLNTPFEIELDAELYVNGERWI